MEKIKPVMIPRETSGRIHVWHKELHLVGSAVEPSVAALSNDCISVGDYKPAAMLAFLFGYYLENWG